MSLIRLAEVMAFPKPALDIDHPMGRAFWLGFRYDLRIVAVAAVITFLISLIKPINAFRTNLGKKLSFAIWAIFTFSFVIIYIAGIAYYSYLGSSLNASVLEYLKEGSTSFGMVMESYPVFWLLLVIIVGTFLLHLFVRKAYHWVKNRATPTTKKARIVSGTAFFLLLAFCIFGRLGQFPLRWSDAFTLGSDYASNMALNPYQSFFSTLSHTQVSFDKKAVQKSYPIMTDFLGIQHPDATKLNFERIVHPDTPSKVKPNVVLVICESFSYVKSSMAGNELDPTPYFNQLSKNGLLFTRCFSPAVGTARGIWAVVAGTPDVERTSTSSRNPGAVNQHTIIADFKGYDKSYFIGGSLSWANIRGLLANNIPGLKTYEQPDYDAPKINVWGVSDKHVFQKANQVFAKETKPFFAVIQTADNHRPYTIPDEDKAAFKLVNYSKKEVQENGFTSLDEVNAFRYTDYCFKLFMEQAKKESYFKNTIFVFVGDHGTKGDASKYFPDAWNNGSLVNMHVPLLFYAPGLIQPKVIHHPASQLDILPTLAGLAKIDYTNTTLGRDLLGPYLTRHPDKYASFIYDPAKLTVGIIQDSIYYYYSANGNRAAKAFSMTGKDPVTLSDSAQKHYHDLTSAFYQTTKYLILNNKVH